MGVVKNSCGLLGHGSLKSAVVLKWIDGLSLFFCILTQIQEG